MLQIKVVENEISSENVSGRVSLFPPGVDVGGTKD